MFSERMNQQQCSLFLHYNMLCNHDVYKQTIKVNLIVDIIANFAHKVALLIFVT